MATPEVWPLSTGSSVQHVVGLQRSIREWAMRQGWGGRPVRVEQPHGILVAAVGVMVNHYGYPEGEQVMDLSFLLRAHAEWVAGLREALYGDGGLNELMAANDEACQLGQWLKDMEPRYAALPAYRAAKEIHKAFHRRAAHCLELINAGRRNDALAETEDEGELRHLSRRLVKELQQLNRAASGVEERRRQFIDSQYE